MAGISTHILNASLGQPAAKVLVKLRQEIDHEYILLDQQFTDADGRIPVFKIDAFIQSNYQLIFEVADYFESLNTDSFYPRVSIDFKVVDIQQHYHVPLLISPFSYSTYRGS
ncbi:hydroxyisourate hydrolase [Acinetobacter sp. NIPH 2100]|uniref:hydroxyisourate hydrolase n=1 Tax=Acinetobacter sp. NIPH 2100 TaxID=1217708 RepID=UPI0002D07A71|nr:hydroxyisourate hydrolase [Acinetobacter sp. NIPH 2100]ENX41907.1 hydroxyisourate hydrolase [Acinetobacter sp. NIPH 2100]